MRILSFDQSTLATGWALFSDSQYVTHGLIDLHKNKDFDSRFMDMCHEIQAVLLSSDPDIVLIEDTVLMRSPKTMKQLSQLQGVIIGLCQMKNIPYEILYPATWRSALEFKQGAGTKRSDLKQQAMDMIYDRYSLKVTNDEADAICIAMAYIKNTGGLSSGENQKK